jgi:hypothetical protein
VKLGIDTVISEEESVCKTEESPVKKHAKKRTFEDLMKDIKKADKSDSESDYDRRLGREFSEDELSGDERDQMQGCILGVIKDFKHYFKYGVPNKQVKIKTKKIKKKAKSTERAF